MSGLLWQHGLHPEGRPGLSLRTGQKSDLFYGLYKDFKGLKFFFAWFFIGQVLDSFLRFVVSLTTLTRLLVHRGIEGFSPLLSEGADVIYRPTCKPLNHWSAHSETSLAHPKTYLRSTIVCQTSCLSQSNFVAGHSQNHPIFHPSPSPESSGHIARATHHPAPQGLARSKFCVGKVVRFLRSNENFTWLDSPSFLSKICKNLELLHQNHLRRVDEVDEVLPQSHDGCPMPLLQQWVQCHFLGPSVTYSSLGLNSHTPVWSMLWLEQATWLTALRFSDQSCRAALEANHPEGLELKAMTSFSQLRSLKWPMYIVS